MIHRLFNCLLLLICGATIYGLFIIKENVRIANQHLTQLTRYINNEKEIIRNLKAEFAYLTSPERLKKIASSQLNLVEVSNKQMIKDPSRIHDHKIVDLTQNNNISAPVKWRYKNNYLQVSSYNKYVKNKAVGKRQ